MLLRPVVRCDRETGGSDAAGLETRRFGAERQRESARCVTRPKRVDKPCPAAVRAEERVDVRRRAEPGPRERDERPPSQRRADGKLADEAVGVDLLRHAAEVQRRAQPEGSLIDRVARAGPPLSSDACGVREGISRDR